MRIRRLLETGGCKTLWFLLSASCASSPAEDVGTTGTGGGFSAVAQHPSVDVCAWSVRPGGARCHSKRRADITTAMSPVGYGPAELASAYDLAPGGGGGKTVAIVDAQDDPNVEADLAVYRASFGLPPCTTSNGCFKKVNQYGVEGSYPAPDTGWAGEISLDVDMVSAGCPTCNIILVEASSAGIDDLGASVNTAVSLGASAVSNSYGGPEYNGVESPSTTYYNHPGVLIVASNGDSGYGADFPASSQYVLAVGGTSLVPTAGPRGWAEMVWSDSGSGCSAFIPKPTWQTDTGCPNRTVGDVAAVADPNTGVAVYQTFGGSGWSVYGGTSVASPLVAAIFVRTGKSAAGPQFVYSNTSDFYDVASGSDGFCGGGYLCTGEVGYDGPTGWGTPNAAAIEAASTPSPPVDAGPPPPSDGGAPPPPPPSGPTCPKHPLCKTGGKLSPGCNPCTKMICATDSYCCTTLWDRICVGEVTSICGDTCP